MRQLNLIIFILISSYANIKAFTIDFWTLKNKQDLIREIIENMSDEELLGQVFMLSYSSSKVNKHIIDWVREKNLGGFKVFGWNAKSINDLIESVNLIQKTAQKNKFKIPLFIATDQEGGWTQHIRLKMSESVGNLGLAATKSPQESYNTGFFIGEELSTLGINMNFAPSVDIYSNYENFAIGPRTFSDDPREVALFSLAFFKGQKEAGIIATAKHFPGHGDTIIDSHGSLPIINIDLKTLRERELVPYKVLIKEDIPAIMSGHLAFPKITDDVIKPASLSKTIIKKILREELNYKNLIITDDLIMNGLKYKNKSLEELTVDIIKSGTDILLISLGEERQNKIYSYLLKKMREDGELKSCIISANYRILNIKSSYLKELSQKVPLFPSLEIALQIPFKDTKDFFEQNTLKSISTMRREKILKRENKTLIISPYSKMFNEAKNFFPHLSVYNYDYYNFYEYKEEIKNEIENLINKNEQVIFNIATPSSFYYLDKLKKHKDKISVVVSLTPQYLKNLKWAQNVIVIYGTSKEAFKGGFLALTDENFKPNGEIPLKNL